MMSGARPLEIRLLGQPCFSTAEKGVRFAAPSKALALLVYLILHRSAPIARERLACALWPDRDEKDAITDLRRHLYYVQKTLPEPITGRPWIIADGESMRWNPEAHAWIDVVAFEEAAASDRWEEAVELYRGALAESLYDEWILSHRERLETLYLEILTQLVVRYRGVRDLRRASDYALRLHASDPWREDAVRQVMAIRYESGDRAGALAFYKTFAVALRRELNAAPMPETIALRETIVRGDPLPLTAVRMSEPARRHFSMLPFAGREEDIRSLVHRWRRTAQGRGATIVLIGEAGIGKSRLAAELMLRTEAEGARVLAGGTSRPEASAYEAVVLALRSALPLAAAVEIPDTSRAALATLFPSFALDERAAAPALEPLRERYRLFEAIAVLLRGLARVRPVLVLLEDLQWAGEATCAAFEYLARRLATVPVMLLATIRDTPGSSPTPISGTCDRLRREGVLEMHRLGRLNLAAVTTIAEHLGPNCREDPCALADRLYAVTSGHPLFLVHAICDLARHGTILEGHNDLSALIRECVCSLDEEAAHAARAAAVLGAAITSDVLRALLGWEADRMELVLDGLVASGLLRESGSSQAGEFVFSHDLVAQAIYDELPDARKRRYHRRAASFLERRHPAERAAEIAHHWDAAGSEARAAEWYLRAAKEALRRFAHEDALRDATTGLERAKDRSVRRDLLLVRERAAYVVGNRTTQHGDLAALAVIAQEDGDRELLFTVHARSCELADRCGDHAAWLSSLDAMRRVADEDKDPYRSALACEYSARRALATADYATALAYATRALRYHDKAGGADASARTHCLIGEILATRGDARLAGKHFEEAARLVSRTADLPLLARATLGIARAADAAEEYARLRDHALEALDLYRRCGDREGMADAHLRAATGYARLLDVAEARSHFDQAAVIYRTLGNRWGHAAVLVNSTVVTLALGLLDEAESALTEAREGFLSVEDLGAAAVCTGNLAYIAERRGLHERAERLARERLRTAREIGDRKQEATALGLLGTALRNTGLYDEAIAHLEDAIALHERSGRGAELIEDLADLASAYALAGRRDEALATAERVATALAALPPQRSFLEKPCWLAAWSYHLCGAGEKAAAMLALGMRLTDLVLRTVDDPAARSAYLALDYVHKLRTAAECGAWPPSPRSTRSRRSRTTMSA